MIFAVNADGHWSNDCQLSIVALHVTPHSSCSNACTVHTAYCWVGAGACGSVSTSECVHVAQSLLVSVCMWLSLY